MTTYGKLVGRQFLLGNGKMIGKSSGFRDGQSVSSGGIIARDLTAIWWCSQLDESAPCSLAAL